MNQTLIKNINIWTMDERDSRFFGWILLENGRIASMGEGETPDCESVWKRSARSTQNCADWTSEWSKAACPI